MSWEQITPIGQGKKYTTINAQKFVRASFSKVPERKHKIENALLRLYIGIDITTTLRLLKDDSIHFFVDKNSPKKWLIKKADRNSRIGFKRMEIARSPSTSLIYQVAWRDHPWMPSEEDYGIRRISHAFEDGGVVVDFGEIVSV